MYAFEEMWCPSSSTTKHGNSSGGIENFLSSDTYQFLIVGTVSRSSSSFISSLLNSILSFDHDQLVNVNKKVDELLKMINAENNLYDTHIKHLQRTHQLSFAEEPRKSEHAVSILAAGNISKRQKSYDAACLSLSVHSSLKVKQNFSGSACTLGEGIYHSFKHQSPLKQQKKPKLTVSFRLTMVGDEMQHLQKTFERHTSHLKIAKQNFLLNICEIKESLVLLRNTAMHLEKILIGDALKFSLKKKIAAQKFIKVFTDLLKRDAEVEGNLKMELKRLTRNLILLNEEIKQKREISESITTISFQQLKIVTKEKVKSLEEKTKYLFEMEKITGKCIQKFNIKKRDLDESMKKLRKVQKTTTEKKLLLSKVRQMKNKAAEESLKALEKKVSIKRLTERCRAPSVLYLARKKAELSNIERNVKNYSRRIECQKNIKRMLKAQIKGSSTEHVNRFGWLKKTSFEKKNERSPFKDINKSNQKIKSTLIKEFRIKPGHEIYLR